MTETSKGDAVILGAVLAAGAGVRFGGPKILAQQGKWLDSAVSALRRGGCGEVVVAMGAAVVDPPAGAGALVVEDWAEGMGASVRAVVGVAAERRVDAVVVSLVDTPDIGSSVIRRVVDVAGGERNALARAVFDGRPGHPVYLGADHFAGVLDLAVGDVGARRYLQEHIADVLDVECGDLATGVDQDLPDR